MTEITPDDLPALPRRDRDGHKGDFGRALVVGGSRRMIGAPALTARAALRGGAGLVVIASPRPVQLAVAMLCECATSIPLDCDARGLLAPSSVRQLKQAAENNDLLAVGPGLAVGPEQQQLVRAAIEQPKPLILDADGLNNLATIPDWPTLRQCPLVLTPHPGEFARLMARPVVDIQADRIAALDAAWQAWAGEGETSEKPLVILLKGAGTVVTDGRRRYVNDTGNPGMATGGSGDVLTGLIAGLALQLDDLFLAVSLAVRLHGRAGDLAADALTEPSLTATDLVEFLPQAMKEATP